MAAPSSSQSQTFSLPAFLQQSKSDLRNKFVDLEWLQRNRLAQATCQPLRHTLSILAPYRRRRLDTQPLRQRRAVRPNRVKLNVADGLNDYINASPIQLGKRKYIATQGPKDTSVNHFYRMLAAEVKSPAVVVMLTQTHESGREKCYQYYPLSAEESPLVIPEDKDAQDGFKGEVHLVTVVDDQTTRSQIRHLRLRTTSDTAEQQETEIYHLLFSAWPDFLIPEGEDRAALVELVQLSAALNTPPSQSQSQTNGHGSHPSSILSAAQDNPRIIHCSAGVGRSGTFIALDYLLSLMHNGQLDDLPPDRDPIADTVDILRQQRMMMVQGENQFRFLYTILREQMLARASVDAAASTAEGVPV